MAGTSYTTATLAADLDTDPRTLRKFLRSKDSGIESVGKGGRYTIELNARDLKGLKGRFAKWTADAEKVEPKGKGKGPTAAQVAAARDAVARVIEEREDDEPTDAELDAVEADEIEL